MKRIKYILCLGVIFLIAACKSLLETAPTDGTVSDASFFKTTNDFDSYMFSAYCDLAGSLGANGVQNWINVTGNISLDINDGTEVPLDLRQYMTASNDQITSFWTNFFDIVAKANLILAKLPDATIPDADKTRLEGEALFFRGFAYSYIARAFGNAPLLLKPYDVSQNNAECTPEDLIWDQVITDLTEAATKIPEEWASVDVGRATKGAAYAFLANAYMYKKDWANAESASNSLIALGKYSLLSRVRSVFSLTIPNDNGESIFEVQYRDILDGKINWNGFSEAGNELPVSTAPANIGVEWAPAGGWGVMIGTRKLADSFEPGDDRRAQLIKVAGEKYKGETMTDTLLIPFDLIQQHSCFSTKYWLGPGAAGASYLERNSTPVMRFAEFLLNYAEILFMQGKTTEGYQQMNQVRERALLPDLPASGDQATFMAALMNERRHELNFEPNLWFHYTRTGTAANFLQNEYGITMEPKWNKFPVPQVERDQNPKLCQNEGY